MLGVDRESRVVAVRREAGDPPPLPDDPSSALVSMGNYLFARHRSSTRCSPTPAARTEHDFGRSIIPELVPAGRVFAYDFQPNEVPGVKPYEEHGYWRDVGTIESYWEAHMDLLGESPRFDLDNRHWPIRTGDHPGPAARFSAATIDNAQIGEGSLVKRATVRNSILGRGVWVNEGAVVEDSIVMDHTRSGRAPGCAAPSSTASTSFPPTAAIGHDPVADRRRYPVDASGLVVVPRGGRREFLRGLEEFDVTAPRYVASTATSTSPRARTRGSRPSRCRTRRLRTTTGTSG